MVTNATDHGDGLAHYAVTERASRGRQYNEPAPEFRSEFQRDRDRIIHCSAFRRLEYKTQVFVNHEGDMFRTRLTHSLEVAQIARTVARALAINEDLTETIALAHDLGHTPFGHAGQQALNACMKNFGGFEHNRQSLRIVEYLEERYLDFPGLNLLFESREGILKHCSAEHAQLLGQIGLRFINKTQPSLEAQLANLADEIAYNHHDIDDGLRANLLTIDQLFELPLFFELYEGAKRRAADNNLRRIVYTVLREMMNYFVVDLITSSEGRLRGLCSGTVDDVRNYVGPLIGFSAPVRKAHLAMKRLLRSELYHHEKVLNNAHRAQRIVRELFETLCSDPSLLSDRGRETDHNTRGTSENTVADYIAGMTDRFAMSEHQRIYRVDYFADA
jgi:dGTPase